MKSPRPKIHIIDVADPLVCFNGLVCRCGTEIKNAEPVFMFSEYEGLCFTFPIRTCILCLRSEPKGEAKRRYRYGLMEAETVLHQMEESA